ncbi:MAG: GldG family protein [Candidatus Omnitrophica bacterium]|nr:GldG family protein [Candidatus Omnitrophota bacterium]
MKWRGILAGTHVVILAIALIVIFAVLYLIAVQFYHRWDLTKDSFLSLSSQTVRVLKSLGDRPVSVYVFISDQDSDKANVRVLLEQYGYYYKKWHYEFVDPERKPALAKRFGVQSYGTVIAKAGDIESRALRPTEEAITPALLRLIQDKAKAVYFTTGHGEHSIEDRSALGFSSLGQYLTLENYSCKPILLMRSSVAEGCYLVVIAGPKQDFLDDEIKALRSYLDKGGRLLVLIDPPEDESLDRLEKMLGLYGVHLERDVVVDEMSKLFGSDYLVPVITQYGVHAITKDFSLPLILPLVRSVSVVEGGAKGIDAAPLAFTGEGSWAEKDLASIDEKGEARREPADTAGPLSVAVATAKKISKESPGAFRLVVIGDSDFAGNRYINLSGNKDFILNSVNWLAGEEGMIAVRPKAYPSTPLLLKAGRDKVIFFVSVVGLPLLVLAVGVAVLISRRR